MDLSLSINCLLSMDCELLHLDSFELLLFGRGVVLQHAELGIQLQSLRLQHGVIFVLLSLLMGYLASLLKKGFVTFLLAIPVLTSSCPS